MRIEVIGAGMVGGTTGAAFDAWGHDVTFKDIDDDRLQELSEQGYSTAKPTDYVDVDMSVICVPTPYDQEEDEFDHSIVEASVSRCASVHDYRHNTLVIHSTVMPGFTEYLADEYDITNIAMVPETLRVDSCMDDMLSFKNVVIGAATETAYTTVRRAYDRENYIKTTPTEAEVIKVASNIFGATKISFANEIWRLAQEYDGDGDQVLDAFLKISPWAEEEGFGPNGLQGGWPYGGACLPKDTKGAKAWFDDDELEAPQLEGTIEENETMKDYDGSKEPQV